MPLNEAVQILGLSPDISLLSKQDLKEAYRKKAQLTHPDKGGTSDEFIKVRKAYTTIRDFLLNKSMNGNEYAQSGSEKSESTYSNQNASWEDRYKDLWARYERMSIQNSQLWQQSKTYEQQIGFLIDIFNQNRDRVNTAVDRFNNLMKNLDSNYHDKEKQLKSHYDRSWWEYVVPTAKMTKEEYVHQHNQLVRSVQVQEQDILDQYNTTLRTIYEETLNSFYSILSQ